MTGFSLVQPDNFLGSRRSDRKSAMERGQSRQCSEGVDRQCRVSGVPNASLGQCQGYAPSFACRALPAVLAGKRDQIVVRAVLAPDPRKQWAKIPHSKCLRKRSLGEAISRYFCAAGWAWAGA